MPGPHGNDDHVRALLDQRAQRADVPPPHTRLSILSDRSDSPSLYSHFDNTYRNTRATPVPRSNRFDDNHDYHDRHDIYPRLSSKERFVDPNASTLDLSEDMDAYSESGSRTADADDSNLVPDEDEDPETRLSLMGPKMRVHSRAPWEEEGSLSEGDSDDGGNDNTSIFGGRKPGIMRNLGFGSKSPAPRPSFDLSVATKGKCSFETMSSVGVTNSSRSAIQALAQASMSSTSLATTPTAPTSRLPHKLSVGHLSSNRNRSTSGPPGTSDARPNYPPSSSPRSVAYPERSSGRESPAAIIRQRDSISPNRSEYSTANIRTHSPSPSPLEDRDAVYTHPYANPALLHAYHVQRRASFARHDQDNAPTHSHVMGNDSAATLATSEETVTLNHSSSTTSASLASTSGIEISTPPTSDFSLVSLVSGTEMLDTEDTGHAQDKLDQQRRAKRETKIGPISAPCLIENGGFQSSKPYNLISLEQAQARVRERNRSATTSAVSFPGNDPDDSSQIDFTPRARSTSATSKTKHLMPLLPVDNNRIGLGDISSPLSPISVKQPSPVGPMGGKVLRPKRSGFMKLFNSRDKDKMPEIPPPLPLSGGRVASQPDPSNSPTSARPPKVSTHRVPVPAIVPSPRLDVNDPRSKRTLPLLSIKVSSPSNTRAPNQMTRSRRSDSPKLLHPPALPRLPTSAPADMTQFPALKLRPVSSFFSNTFAEQFLSEEQRPESPRNAEVSSLISPTTVASSDLIPSPVNAMFSSSADSSHSYGSDHVSMLGNGDNEDQTTTTAALKELIRTSRIKWQRQIWELEGQIRDLRAEIDDLKGGDVCDVCGRGGSQTQERKVSGAGVLHRPRAKTGHGARFASGNEA